MNIDYSRFNFSQSWIFNVEIWDFPSTTSWFYLCSPWRCSSLPRLLHISPWGPTPPSPDSPDAPAAQQSPLHNRKTRILNLNPTEPVWSYGSGSEENRDSGRFLYLRNTERNRLNSNWEETETETLDADLKPDLLRPVLMRLKEKRHSFSTTNFKKRMTNKINTSLVPFVVALFSTSSWALFTAGFYLPGWRQMNHPAWRSPPKSPPVTTTTGEVNLCISLLCFHCCCILNPEYVSSKYSCSLWPEHMVYHCDPQPPKIHPEKPLNITFRLLDITQIGKTSLRQDVNNGNGFVLVSGPDLRQKRKMKLTLLIVLSYHWSVWPLGF